MNSQTRGKDRQSSFAELPISDNEQPASTPRHQPGTPVSYRTDNRSGDGTKAIRANLRCRITDGKPCAVRNVQSATTLPRTLHRLGDALGSEETMTFEPLASRPTLTEWRRSFLPKSGPVGLRYFETAERTPPVSASSLRELELQEIMRNPKLRHDLNFDQELHFRPNLEGNRGQTKVEQAEGYWTALETELELYEFMLTDAAGEEHRWTTAWTAEFRACQQRIPKMFKTLREVILKMMPTKDQGRVIEALDIPLIMGQIERGCFDISQFAEWLSKLLKAHCAPIRDQMVDKMAEEMAGGDGEASIEKAVQGLKELFGVLEAMKLDIANHQIRVLRPILIESTRDFETSDSTKKWKANQEKFMVARRWYDCGLSGNNETGGKDANIQRFIKRLVDSLLTRSDKSESALPPTFYLDYDRLDHLRKRISFAIGEEIFVIRLKCMLHNFKGTKSHIESVTLELRRSLPALVKRFWPDHKAIRNVAVEIVRLVRTTGQAGMYDSFDHSRTSLDRGNGRRVHWTDLIDETEKQLVDDFQAGRLFHHQSKVLAARLCIAITNLVFKHIQTRPLELFESFVGSKTKTKQLTHLVEHAHLEQPKHANSQFDQICQRLTHVIVLHWSAWGPLVYTKDGRCANEEIAYFGGSESSDSEPDGSRSNSLSSTGSSMSCDPPPDLE